MESLFGALQGLQQDAERRSEYNEWLQKFQRTSEAWTVCSQVLGQDAELGAKIFCAQTLRNKAMHDLHQVPNNKLELKENFLTLLKHNATIHPVCVQLCVALANLAMQTPEWEQPLDEMVTKLGDTHLLPCLLEFLKILPEDFGTFGRAQRATRAKTLVGENAPKVLNLLLEKAQYLTDHRSIFFEALLPWIPEVSVLDLVKSPMLDWILSALTSDDTISAATDCLCAIIHETDEIRDPVSQQAIEILLPKLLSLCQAREHYDDFELHRNMTLIFSRAAEDWHMLIIEQEAFKPLFDAVCDCIDVTDADLDVIEYTFGFLDKLQLSVSTPLYEERRSYFAPGFARLQKSFTTHLQYRNFSSKQEEDNFKDFRYDIGDMIKICTYFLGPDQSLSIAGDGLKGALEAPSCQWQVVEAILFCIRLMARLVPVDNQVLPSIFDMFPKLPNHPKVIHAALMIFGRYSEWAAQHTNYIDFELQYIIQGVTNETEDVRRAAAYALHYFLTDCSKVMVSYTPQLVQFYNSLSGHISGSSLQLIAEGIGAIINNLNGTDSSSALESVFSPVLQRIGQAQTPEQINVLGDDIEALGGFVYTVRSSGDIEDNSPITLCVKHCHQQIMQVYQQHGAENGRLAEGVVQYYIRAVRNCALAITPLLESLLEITDVVFQKHLNPVFPQLFGALAQAYNDRQDSMAQFDVIDILYRFFDHQTTRIVEYIESVTQLSKVNTDFLESTFNFWSDYSVYYTPKFVFSDNFERTIKIAVNCLALGDTKVLVSVANYFEDLSVSSPTMPRDNPLDQTIASRIASIIKKHGEKLVYIMFTGYQFDYDRDFLYRADTTFDFVVRVGQPESIEWIRSAYSSLPEGSVTPQETLESLQYIFSLMASGQTSGVGQAVQQYARGYVERNILPR